VGRLLRRLGFVFYVVEIVLFGHQWSPMND